VLLTYVTHYWVMAGIAAWLLLGAAPQLFVGITHNSAPRNFAPMVGGLLGMPLLFLSIMLVPQAKAQFAHSRAVLTPHFFWPHAAVLGGVTTLLIFLFPLAVAYCCHLDPLGTIALAAAIVAPAIWGSHTNRMLGMLVALGVFYSTMTTTGVNWWLHPAAAHPLIYCTIFATGLGMIVAWIIRLGRIREEMDDYQNVVQWRASRRSGIEVSEQRRIVAEQLRRNKLLAWINDAWLDRIGGYHGGRIVSRARLLRYGFGRPAELQALFMTIMFSAITLFLAKFSFKAERSGFASIMFYVQVAWIFPGMFAGEWLAQRRPRIAGELLLPLSRRQLIDGLFAATLWSAGAFWLVMNVGLVFMASLTLGDRFGAKTIITLLVMTAASAFALASLSLRAAVWPSYIRRLGTILLAMLLLQIPLLGWSFGRERVGDAQFLLAPVIMIAVGLFLITRARRAWLNLELG
jgi:hypothetical protein